MATTPVDPQSTMAGLTRTPNESTRWKALLDALEPARPLELIKQGGRVRLTRSIEQDENGKDSVIWTKTYQGARNGNSGEIDLSIFNAWERTLILKAHDDGLDSCYRIAHLVEKGSILHTDDLPRSVEAKRTTVIKTHHTGADLDIWRVMRPWSQGSMLEHPFVKQQHFLKLIRGVLIALYGFHSKRFVHCDLHPGNIILPADIKKQLYSSVEGDHYQLIAKWDQIKLIDLGYSIHKGIEAPAMLPLALWELTSTGEFQRDTAGEKIPSKRMSPHLHSRLKNLDTIASKWPASEVFSRSRWQQHQEQLRILQELDWREDLYQLGYWLTKIRDGDDAGSWGDVCYVGDVVNVREVNAFIDGFPEELMEWSQKRPLPQTMPHIGYIRRIDELISLLPPIPDSFTLRRRDFDSAYQTYVDLYSAQKLEVKEKSSQARSNQNNEDLELDKIQLQNVSALTPGCSIDSEEEYANYPKEGPGGHAAEAAKSVKAQYQSNQMLQRRSQRWSGWQAHARLAITFAHMTLGLLVLTGAGWVFLFIPTQYAWTQWIAPAWRQWQLPNQKQVAVPLVEPKPAPVVVTASAMAGAPVQLGMSASEKFADYSARTAEIEKSDWWTKGRSMKLSASIEQTNWVNDTITYAKENEWPRAQFALASLYCSGAHTVLVPPSTGECGRWMSIALTNRKPSIFQSTAHEHKKMIDVVVSMFDDMVIGFSQGKFHNTPPDNNFARTLLPGLQALQTENAGMALRAAHVQACNLKPDQRAAASETLHALVQKFPNSPEAIQAEKWLTEWRSNDFWRCRSN